MRGLLLWCLLLGYATLMLAQKNIESQNNLWLTILREPPNNGLIGDYTPNYQWRRHNWGKTWQQSLARIGIEYYTQKGPRITTGYGWIVSYPYGIQPISYTFNEHRIWQQLILQQKYTRLSIQHRYRLEQRFLERKELISSSSDYEFLRYDFKQRARYRVLLNLTLNNKELKDKTWFLGVSDEVFLGFGKGIGKNIMEQNRITGTLGYRFNPTFTIQAGYLNQFIQKADGIRAENNHNAMVSFFYNLDFRDAD